MTRHGLLWLIAIIAIFMCAPLVVTETEYRACMAEEIDEAAEWYDSDEVEQILRRANSLYSKTIVGTGIDQVIRKHFAAPMEVPAGVRIPREIEPYATRVSNYWSGFLYNIWLFYFRLAHSWSWVLYLMPFLIAVCFDGVMTRKAKLASFLYTSPTIYNISWHVIIAMMSGALVIFSLVIPLTVFVYPVVITTSGIMLRLLISNIQHSA